MLDSIVTQIQATSWLEWLGTITGIVGVWLSIKEKLAAWPLFITCYSCYVFLTFAAELYAALMMNLVFIGLSFYGWWRWSRNAKAGSEAHRISATPLRSWFICGLLWIIGTASIGYLLSEYSSAFRPYFDAFATSGAFIAQWMLGRKQYGTWLCWIISDSVFITLWHAQGYWLTLILYTVFIILAVKGWREWRNSLIRRSTC